MRFRTTVMAPGRTATGLPVRAEVVDGLGAGRRDAADRLASARDQQRVPAPGAASSRGGEPTAFRVILAR
jgi:hypothetical protein